MDDPYQTLGVSKTASQDDIRRAYHKLAKQHHPDLNPGDKAAEERFKKISSANELVSDTDKRGQFDRGEIDAAGEPLRPAPSYRGFAEGPAGGRYSRTSGDPGNFSSQDFGDIFGSFFDENNRSPRAGEDKLYALDVAFLDCINGATRRLTLADGADFDVKIPVGTEEGQVLRLRGKGGPSRNGGPAGDVLIEIHVTPHGFFRRDGQTLSLDLPVTFAECVLGAQVNVPTPTGPVRMRIPAQSDTGSKLRLRGRGVPAHGRQTAGDLIAVLRLVVGTPDAALRDFLAGWTPAHPDNPRADLEVAT